MKFEIERGKGSFLSFIVTLQPSDRQIDRPLFIDRLNNIPMFVRSNEPPPNRAIHGNLRYWGLRCDGAPTFQEGILEITRQASLDDPYRLVIVSQPIEDGTAADVAREIKGSALRSTKLVHIDRFFNQASEQESLAAGFDAYMSKPFTTAELLNVISNQLRVSLVGDEGTIVPMVLVVDDNLTNQKIAMFQLRRLGITPDITANGKEAMEALLRKHYCLVLLDIEMPIMNGYETLRRMRQMQHLAQVPVVMLTAEANDNAEDECMKCGATAFFTKPVKLETMAALVGQYCKCGRHARAS